MPTFSLSIPKRLRERVTALPIEQSVFVPSTQKADQPVNTQEMEKRVNAVRGFFTDKFGGTTSVEGSGTFKSKTGKVISEPVVKVTSFSKVPDAVDAQRQVFSQVGTWARKWGQESVGYEFEGDLFLIEPR